MRFALTEKHFSNSINSGFLFALITEFASQQLGVRERNIVLATSFCSDDLNSVELPRTNMIGPFFLGGLDGFPFVGAAGIGAFSHHVPEDGLALLIFGPHVGIGDGPVGTVIRPGQSDRTTCCGSLAGALKALLNGLPPSEVPELDYQQLKIYSILEPHKASLQSLSPDECFILATNLIYDATSAQIASLIPRMTLDHKPAIVIGGVLINEDDAFGSRMDVRSMYLLNGVSLKNSKMPQLDSNNLLARFGEFAMASVEHDLKALRSIGKK